MVRQDFVRQSQQVEVLFRGVLHLGNLSLQVFVRLETYKPKPAKALYQRKHTCEKVIRTNSEM